MTDSNQASEPGELENQSELCLIFVRYTMRSLKLTNKCTEVFVVLFSSIIWLKYVNSYRIPDKNDSDICPNFHRLSDMTWQIPIGQRMYSYRTTNVNWPSQTHKNLTFVTNLSVHIGQTMLIQNVKIAYLKHPRKIDKIAKMTISRQFISL